MVEGVTAWAVWFAPDSTLDMSRVSHGCESNGSLPLRILKGELGKLPAACWWLMEGDSCGHFRTEFSSGSSTRVW